MTKKEAMVLVLGLLVATVLISAGMMRMEQSRRKWVEGHWQRARVPQASTGVLQLGPHREASRGVPLPKSPGGWIVTPQAEYAIGLPDRNWDMTEADMDTPLSGGRTVRDVIMACVGSSFPKTIPEDKK